MKDFIRRHADDIEALLLVAGLGICLLILRQLMIMVIKFVFM